MTNAIVLNTMTGAVSEYSGFDFQSATPTHAGNALGLYALGGDLDGAAPIDAQIITGKPQWGSSLKKFVSTVYFAMKGAGMGELTVYGENDQYTYTFPVRASGESRCQTGRGIRENYMAFGFCNIGGAAFRLDRIEALTAQSTSRRV